MENVFNLLSTATLITILVYLFILFFNRHNYKYFLPVFSALVLALCIDFAGLELSVTWIINFLLLIFFVFAVFIFLKRELPGSILNYEKKIAFVTGLFFVYYLLLVFKTAWISDDAYITFRVADNFVNGYGLRWNVEERVQVFTNTLFLFVFMPFYFIFRDAYFVALFLNFLFCIPAVLLLKKITGSMEKFLLVIAGLSFSKAYIDFSTSGLENSLTFFLLVMFLYVFFRVKDPEKKSMYSFLVFSALFLNRPDAVLIIIPAILFMLYKTRPSIKSVFYGLIPLLVWEIFSIIYYGFPLPNTFYAKLITGIDRFDLIKQGGIYFLVSFLCAPVTLFIIFSAVFLNLLFLSKMKNTFLTYLNIGILMYLLYVLTSGGDFMVGRFFVCLLPVSLFIITGIIDNKKYLFGLLFSFVFLVFFSPYYSVWDLRIDNKELVKISNQIISEREFYYRVTGLLNVLKEGKKSVDESGYARDAKRIKNDNQQPRKAGISIAIGMFGFYAGPDVFIIDQVSISDAFLARLPAAKRWRIGHFSREWPEGYEETLRQGVNLIKDKKLSEFYDKISLVTKGKIFTRERFKAIVEVNSGKDFHAKR